MVVIREFETMLNLIKTRNEYNGVEYNHPGPAHLSIGQEAAAVGMAYTLGVEDFIFGSHRSHGEILAKGLSAIDKLTDEQLTEIMDTHFDGITLAPVKAGHTGTTKELAIKFLIYGTLAEVFARKTGFNKGLGGSMHAFFTPFGVYPNNAIVGGSGDISVGAALYKRTIFCNNGPIYRIVGRRYERWTAFDYQHYEQPIWNGWTNLWRNHGLRYCCQNWCRC